MHPTRLMKTAFYSTKEMSYKCVEQSRKMLFLENTYLKCTHKIAKFCGTSITFVLLLQMHRIEFEITPDAII